MLNNESTHRLASIAITLFGIGFVVHLVTLYIATGHLATYRFIHLPLHAAIEAAGAFLALMSAYLLWRLHAAGQGSRFNLRISAALIAMGILDGLHALTSPGQLFVWLHSSATLLGGFLFLLVWLPRSKISQSLPHWPRWTVLLTVLMVLLSLFLPEQIPQVVAQGNFTRVFVVMNVIGGAFMLIAALRMVLSYYRHKVDEDILFSLQCVIFGFGALVYQQSELWNITWWASHLLRLIAYAVSLWLLARVVSQAEDRMRQQVKVLELEAANLRLLTLSVTDGLTGVANRRCFDQTLLEEWQRAARSRTPIALALIDVDYFKKYNDCYGHQAGDLVARYGGEEFVVIASTSTSEQLFTAMNMIREQLQQKALEHHQSPLKVVTLSIGVSSCVACVDDSPEQLIKKADTALYHAKSQGRNQVVIYREDQHTTIPHQHN